MTLLLRRLWDRAWIGLDGLSWRVRAARLYSPVPKFDPKVVLICDLLTFLTQAKVEALFSAALATRGCRIVILLRDRRPSILNIFRSVGPFEFVFLEDFLTEDVWSAASHDSKRLIDSVEDLHSLLDLNFEGYRVGRNVLSRVLREFRVGSFDRADLQQVDAFRSFLCESFALISVAKSLLERINPDHAIFLEKGYTPSGELFDACLLHGVDTVQWLSAPQADHLLFKRYTLASRSDHPFALGDSTWSRISEMPWGEQDDARVLEKIANHYQSGAWYNRQQLQVGKQLIQPKEVRTRLGLSHSRKVAVIFAHILYDATFFYGSSIYRDYEHWLVETVRCAIANPKLDWIIKVHPVNVWRSRNDGVPMDQLEIKVLYREFGALPDHVSVMHADTDINTFSLFTAIDYGLTVRGTIGMELPCYGVPVVTAGTGRYSGRGFTVDHDSVASYQATLANLHNLPRLTPEQIRLARKHAHGAFFRRPFPLHSFRIVDHARSFGVRALTQNILMRPTAVRNALLQGDLATIADFVLDGTIEDLLT